MATEKKGKRLEAVFKLVLIAFLLILMWMAKDYPEKSRLFPMIIFSITILLIIGSFIQDLFIKSRSTLSEKVEAGEEPAPSPDVPEETLKKIRELESLGESDAGYEVLEDSLRRKRLREAIVIILVSLGIGYAGGFLLTVPFYFLAFGLLHGKKGHLLRYVVIAAGITAVTYVFFDWLMGVPLRRGLWWG